MKEKIKHIFIGALIGVITLPIISLGGTFVSSLIQGKTIEEAVQILATQIDFLIGRVEVLESGQSEQEQMISELQRQEACRKIDDLLYQTNVILTRNFTTGGKVRTIDSAIFLTQHWIESTDPVFQDKVELQENLIKYQELKAEQLVQEAICEQLDSEQITKKEACRRVDWILKQLEYLPEYEQIVKNPESDYQLQVFQIKINRLHELEIELPTQKEICERP